MNTIDWVIVGTSILLVLVVGLRGAKHMSIEDYWVNGRRTPGLMLFATTVATYVGVGAIMSNAAFAYSGGGLCTLFYLSSFFLYFLIFARYVAPRIKKFGDEHHAFSIPDFLAIRFSHRVRVVGLILVLIAGSLWLALQILGIATFFSHFGMLDAYWATALGGLAVIVYSAVGGLRADIRTDVVQFFLMLVIIAIVLPLLASDAGGLSAVAALPPGYLLGTKVLPLPVFFVAFLVFGVSCFTSVDLWQRAYAANSIESVRRTMLWAAAVCFLFFVAAAFLGVFGHILLPGQNADTLLPRLLETYIPTGVRGLAVAALLAAILSSADTYLLVLSMSLVHDLYEGCFGRTIPEGSLLHVSRITTLIVGVAAVAAALIVFSLFHLALQASSFTIVLTPAIILGFFWERVTERGAFWGTISAGGALLVFMFLDPLTAFIPALLVGFLVMWGLRERVTVSLEAPACRPADL